MNSHFYYSETVIDRPLAEVFEFFSTAENLNKLTPQALEFKILTPLPIVMKQGALIDYKLKLSGIPFYWKTEISAWNPPYSFVDKQIKGPYKIWIHEHTFKEVNGKTHMRDMVEFLSPGWILEPIINALFVRKKVNEIFSYREKVLAELFPRSY